MPHLPNGSRNGAKVATLTSSGFSKGTLPQKQSSTMKAKDGDNRWEVQIFCSKKCWTFHLQNVNLHPLNTQLLGNCITYNIFPLSPRPSRLGRCAPHDGYTFEDATERSNSPRPSPPGYRYHGPPHRNLRNWNGFRFLQKFEVQILKKKNIAKS